MFKEKLRSAADYVSALGYTPIYVSLHGSQNYGLDIYTETYQSDFDFKCIVLPSLWDLVEGKRPASLTVETDGGQIDIKDIRVFCDALERMNPAYLESLATGHCLILLGGDGMEMIRDQLPELMKQRASVFARACEGLFEDKARRMCRDCPAAHERIMRYGYDGKQAHHMYRLLMLMQEFEKSSELHLEVSQEERVLLMQLKLNLIPLEKVQKMIPEWRAALHAIRMQFEEKGYALKNDAITQIVRIAREMMHAYCLHSHED